STPVSATLPALSALLEVSHRVSAVLLDDGAAPVVPGGSQWLAGARESVAFQLRRAASRVRLTDAVLARLRRAEALLGASIVDADVMPAGEAIAEVLVPGARICFTGTALDDSGVEVPRERMEVLATAAGLTPVKTVTKTRCEVLVTAEAGTQSGKAQKALDYGKPVFSADEFFEWLDTRPS
ncbi:MAG: AAA family ATPase, partial [Mycobacterium sp.]